MFIADTQFFAVILCFITMLCWGSWGNTQKLSAATAKAGMSVAFPLGVGLALVIGVFACNFLFNGIFTLNDLSQPGVKFADYFKGDCKTHLVGMLGGAIWCLGTGLNYVSAGTAGAAVSYALGQGAPLVASIWGVFIWKEFKGAKKGVNSLLVAMFCLFIAGLAVIIAAGN